MKRLIITLAALLAVFFVTVVIGNSAKQKLFIITGPNTFL